jgi:hypothetical protein
LNYLLDSNTYIQAKNFHYDMDFCPAYWDWLDSQFISGQLASISSVYDELSSYGDELSTWVKARRGHFLPITEDETQEKYAEIVQHVYELENKNPENVANFLDKADPWLIAKAEVTGATIVTHEVLDPPNSKRVKIPNICKEFDVDYITTYQLLRTLEARFILATP